LYALITLARFSKAKLCELLEQDTCQNPFWMPKHQCQITERKLQKVLIYGCASGQTRFTDMFFYLQNSNLRDM